MATLQSDFPETFTPTPDDARLAQEASRTLAKLLGAKKTLQLRIQPDDEPAEAIAIPLPAVFD